MLIRNFSKGEKVLMALRTGLTYALFAGLIVLAGYLGWLAMELKADLRVQNAEGQVRIQMLEGELEHLRAKEVGLRLEGAALQEAAHSKTQSPR